MCRLVENKRNPGTNEDTMKRYVVKRQNKVCFTIVCKNRSQAKAYFINYVKEEILEGISKRNEFLESPRKAIKLGDIFTMAICSGWTFTEEENQ